MKVKLLLTIFLLLLPLSLAPAQPVAQVGQSTNPTPSYVGTTEQVETSLTQADEPYLAEWRSLVNNFDRPAMDYSISHPEFESSQISNYLFEADDTFDDSLSIDQKPCDTCLKKSKSILIDENKDFRKYDGSGTEADPYLIEGLAITDGRRNLIQIVNTDVYVIIRGNMLDGENSGLGNIVLNNVAHITIVANNITNNDLGIMVSHSSDVSVYNNRVYGHNSDSVTITDSTDVSVVNNSVTNNGLGVVVDSSSNGVVEGNVISGNTGAGITLSYSSDYLITQNTIFDNDGDGIFFQDSNDNSISGNTIYSNGYSSSTTTSSMDLLSYTDGTFTIDASFGGSGIYLDPSFNNVVDSNVVYDNAAMGIFLELSGNTSINANSINNNGLSGVFFIDSNDNEITNNNIAGNGVSSSVSSMLNGLSPMDYFLTASFGGSGIYLDPSLRNTISGNNITSNLGEGIVLEYSDQTTIDSNAISNNGLNGIMFIDSDDSSITNNQIVNNGADAASIVANSQLSPLETKLMASFGGSGIYLDPSHLNTIDGNVVMDNAGAGVLFLESTTSTIRNNQILSNGGDGVFFINSTKNEIIYNLIDSNGHSTANSFLDSITAENLKLYASFGGSGIYLDPSPNNLIEGNVITNSAASGIYFLETNNSIINENYISTSGAEGIFFQDSSYNKITSNAIEDSGVTISTLAAELDASFGGSGIYLDPSHYNELVLNNISRSAGDGIFSEASSNTYVSDNRLHDNGAYGVNLDDFSSNFAISENNFKGNTNPGVQARDDGISNDFSKNFYNDADNNDTDYDGISDDPYEIDGDAGTVDESPSNIPLGLNFYSPESESSPRKLNADSEGSPLTFKVYMDDGFRVLNISLDKLWLNRTINPYTYHIIDILTFTVTFDRQQVNALVNSLGLETPFNVTFELFGRINDGLLEITTYDDVLINQTEDTTSLVLVAGFAGVLAVPSIRNKKDGKVAKFLDAMKTKFL